MMRRLSLMALGVLCAGVASAVVVGNEDWNPPWGGAPTTNDATFSDHPSEMTGRVITGSKWAQAYKWDVPLYYGCVDGTFGTNTTVSANSNQVNNSALQAQDNTAYVDFELTAGAAFNVTLEAFHFDAWRQYEGGGTSGYKLEILSGGALTAQIVEEFGYFLVDGPASTNNPPNLDYQDIDIELDTLTDGNVLPAGQTVVFRLTYDKDAAGWSGQGFLDNMAVSGTAEALTVPGIAMSGSSNEVSIANGSTTYAWNNATKYQSEYGREPSTNVYTIYSTGNVALELTGTPVVNMTGDTGVFNITAQPTTTSMAPETSQTFELVYTPDMEDTTNYATITIENNDTNFTFNIQGISPLLTSDLSVQSLEGQGWVDNKATNEADVAVLKGTDIVSAPIGGSVSSPLIIHAGGFTNLMLGAITIDGDAEFSVIQPAETMLEKGTNTTFSVVYAPTVAGTTNTAIITIPNNSTFNNPFTFMVRGVGRVEAPGQVLAGWTWMKPDGTRAASETAPTVGATNSTTVSGGAWAYNNWNDSQDYIYGSTGGQVSLHDYNANRLGSCIRYNTLGSGGISNNPTLTISISNESPSSSIQLTSIHLDGVVSEVGALDQVEISLAGDLSGIVTTQLISQVGTGWPAIYGHYDVSMNETLGPNQTADIVFTILNAPGVGNWKEVLLDNIAVKGIVGATVSPNIMSFAVSSGTGTLVWESEDGITYKILGKSALQDTWGTNTSGVASGGSSTTGTVSAAAGAGFFMIEAE